MTGFELPEIDLRIAPTSCRAKHRTRSRILTTHHGSTTEPETKVGLETSIEQIEGFSRQLKDLEAKRLQLSGEIFDTLDARQLVGFTVKSLKRLPPLDWDEQRCLYGMLC